MVVLCVLRHGMAFCMPVAVMQWLMGCTMEHVFMLRIETEHCVWRLQRSWVCLQLVHAGDTISYCWYFHSTSSVVHHTTFRFVIHGGSLLAS